MKFFFTFSLCLLFFNNTWSQEILEKTNIRLYEHHSTIPGESFLSGRKSGYDLVEMKYAPIFDETQDPISQSERSGLDIHEFFSLNSAQSIFIIAGFTSGNVNGGSFGGNNTTLFSKASSGFDYGAISTITDITNAYDPGTASKTISNLAINDVYIAKLRGSENYVAIKITGLLVGALLIPGDDENYFDFSYKYLNPEILSVNEFEETTSSFITYPNPVKDKFTFEFKGVQKSIKEVTIYTTNGSVIRGNNIIENTIDFSSNPAGMYFMTIQFDDDSSLIKKIVKI